MLDEEHGQAGPSHTQGLLTGTTPSGSEFAASASAHPQGVEDIEDGLTRTHVQQLDCFDYFCRFLNITTAVAAMLCLIANGMAIALYSPTNDLKDVLDQALCVCAMLGALLIALVELEWERLVALIRFTHYWTGRAVLQIFVALLTFKMATAEGRSCDPMNPHRSCDFNKTLEVYRFASAMTLLGCGSFYLLGGILCFGLLRRARVQKEEKRCQAEADLLELEKRREILHGLLGHTDTGHRA